MGMITQEAYFRQRVFELCGKARSHSRSDPVPHELKNGTQVEKAIRWDRGKPTGSAAYAPSFSTPTDIR